MDERGVLQIHPSTAKDIGISDADFAYLNVMPGQSGFDFDRHYHISSLMLIYYRKLAVRKLEERGVDFTGRDFYAIVKLLHGLPAIVTAGLDAFIAAHGHTPSSWSEWAGWLRASGWHYGDWDGDRVSEILHNAEVVAGFAPDDGLGLLGGLLALGVGAGLGWLAWRRWGAPSGRPRQPAR